MTQAETLRAKQRRETREALFVAALEEFFAAGVGAAKIDRIVERVGVARGTFYFHFPTKDHVLYELSDRTEGMIAESIELGDDASVADVLRKVFDTIRSSMNAVHGDVRRELLASLMRRRPAPEESPLLKCLAKAIDNGKARGDVQPHLNSIDLARTFLSAAFGSIALSVDDDAATASLDLLVHIGLRGVLTQEALLRLSESSGEKTRAA